MIGKTNRPVFNPFGTFLEAQRQSQYRQHLNGSAPCELPRLPLGVLTVEQQPDWECGVCGRIWRNIVGVYGGSGTWKEIRGPLGVKV